MGVGDLEHVTSQVVESGIAVTDRQTVHIPLGVPDGGAAAARQRAHRQIEGGAGGVPLAFGAGQRAAGDQVVNVGMALQFAAPGVEHAEEAGQSSGHLS